MNFDPTPGMKTAIKTVLCLLLIVCIIGVEINHFKVFPWVGIGMVLGYIIAKF